MESLAPFLQGTCTPYNMPVYPGAQRIIAESLVDQRLVPRCRPVSRKTAGPFNPAKHSTACPILLVPGEGRETTNPRHPSA